LLFAAVFWFELLLTAIFPENSSLQPRGSGVSPDIFPLLAGGNTKGDFFRFRGGEATMTIPAFAGMTAGMDASFRWHDAPEEV